jgi:predicted lipoprotein
MRAALPNARYAAENEALAELLKANVSGLEVAHKKLVSALGEKYPQPYLAEYWRSGASLTSARAVIEGSQALWQSGFAERVKKQDAALADDIAAQYSQVLNNGLLDADAVTPPLLSDLLKTQEGRQSIAVLANAMKDLHMAFARDVSKVLQLPLGINAHDGD